MNTTPKAPADAAETARRIDDLVAEWRAVATTTAPADRPRAETIIAELFDRARLRPPEFEWVESPLAGVIRADRLEKSGATQPINATWVSRIHRSDPLAIDHGWLTRRRKHLRLSMGVPDGEIDATRTSRRLQLAIGAGIEAALNERLPRLDAFSREAPPADRTARMAEIGRSLYPESWDDIAGWIGSEVLVEDFERRFVELINGSFRDRARTFRSRWSNKTRLGQFDSFHPDILATRDAYGIRMERSKVDQIDLWLDLARSCGPWWSFDGLAIVCERPLVTRLDDAGRPHADDGPAIAYPDGFEVWASHGVTVPEWMIREPQRIDPAAIDAADNAEVRRVMIERFGADRLVREGRAELVDEDDRGRLWRRPIGEQTGWDREEPIVMVEVLNSTPNADGSRNAYFLRVPPTTQTAREAVAWTFGMAAGAYEPAVES